MNCFKIYNNYLKFKLLFTCACVPCVEVGRSTLTPDCAHSPPHCCQNSPDNTQLMSDTVYENIGRLILITFTTVENLPVSYFCTVSVTLRIFGAFGADLAGGLQQLIFIRFSAVAPSGGVLEHSVGFWPVIHLFLLRLSKANHF